RGVFVYFAEYISVLCAGCLGRSFALLVMQTWHAEGSGVTLLCCKKARYRIHGIRDDSKSLRGP
ncbi:MAG: hypothetical protein ACKN95_08790, partial [Holophagaceae bacterium]